MFRISEYKGAIVLGLVLAVVLTYGPMTVVHAVVGGIVWIIFGVVALAILGFLGMLFGGSSHQNVSSRQMAKDRKQLNKNLKNLNDELKRRDRIGSYNHYGRR